MAERQRGRKRNSGDNLINGKPCRLFAGFSVLKFVTTINYQLFCPHSSSVRKCKNAFPDSFPPGDASGGCAAKSYRNSSTNGNWQRKDTLADPVPASVSFYVLQTSMKFSKNICSIGSPMEKCSSGCHWVAKMRFSLLSIASITPSSAVATTVNPSANRSTPQLW